MNLGFARKQMAGGSPIRKIYTELQPDTEMQSGFHLGFVLKEKLQGLKQKIFKGKK